MHSISRIFGVTLLASGIFVAAGCGGGSAEQSYSEQEVKTVSETDQVRTWLESVSQNGQLDSGAVLMQEKIATLNVPNKDELSQEMEKLMGMRAPAQIKAQAQKMLEMLPKA
jgi:hypothetical protein